MEKADRMMKAKGQDQASGSGAAGEWRNGWPVVLSGAIGYGTGGAMILLLASLFIKPMRDALGWSTSAVTIAPIITLVWALCYPMAGAAIDRFGGRRVAIFGSVGLAGCALLLATVPISRVSFYGTAVLIGLFCSLTAVPTYTRGIASWFRSGVGLAFGVALSGSALVAIGATPLTGTTIDAFGWRAGYLTLAGIILLIGLPAILLGYRERPGTVHSGDAEAPAAGRRMGEAVRDARFWCYFAAFGIACIPLGGFVGHLQPLLASKGFPLAQALSLGVLYALAMSFGKIAGGLLLDRLWPFGVAAAITTVAAAGPSALPMPTAGRACRWSG